MSDKFIECRRCINTTANPSVSINQEGLCNVCAEYLSEFSENGLREELQFFKTLP